MTKSDSSEMFERGMRSHFTPTPNEPTIHVPLFFGYKGYENQYELYDLTNDPEDLEDIYLSRRSVAAELKNVMAEKIT